MKYVVMGCAELSDQWECDASRTPIAVIDDIHQVEGLLTVAKSMSKRMEVWPVAESGTIAAEPLDCEDVARMVLDMPYLQFDDTMVSCTEGYEYWDYGPVCDDTKAKELFDWLYCAC